MMMAKSQNKLGIEFFTYSDSSLFTLYDYALSENQTAIMTVQQLTSSGEGTPVLLSASQLHSTSDIKGAVFYYGVERPNNNIYIRGGGTWSVVSVTPTPNNVITLVINKNQLKIQIDGVDAATKDISKYASDFGTSIKTIIGARERNTIFYDFKVVDDISGREISHVVPKMDGDTPILYDIVLNKKIEIPEDFILTPIFK